MPAPRSCSLGHPGALFLGLLLVIGSAGAKEPKYAKGQWFAAETLIRAPGSSWGAGAGAAYRNRDGVVFVLQATHVENGSHTTGWASGCVGDRDGDDCGSFPVTAPGAGGGWGASVTVLLPVERHRKK